MEMSEWKEELRKKEGRTRLFAMNLSPHRDEVMESSWGEQRPLEGTCAFLPTLFIPNNKHIPDNTFVEGCGLLEADPGLWESPEPRQEKHSLP